MFYVLQMETKPFKNKQLCMFHSVLSHYIFGFCELSSPPYSKVICQPFSHIFIPLFFLFS